VPIAQGTLQYDHYNKKSHKPFQLILKSSTLDDLEGLLRMHSAMASMPITPLSEITTEI